METNNYSFDTLCVKGRKSVHSYDNTGSVSLPIFQTATYAHPELGNSTGFDYSRLSNPTRQYLEDLVAALDGAKYGFAFSSGMAAITAFFNMVPKGSHIICSDDLYGGSARLLNTIIKKEGSDTTFVDTSSLENIEKAFRPETKVVFIETPGNPLMTITDIRKTAALAHSRGAILAVDNTFLTAYYQKPLALGADVVLQSGTKFLAGHNDTLAGFVTTSSEKIAEDMSFITKTTGAMLSPFDSWLVARGIKTLSVRMDKQSANAMKIARFLKSAPHVKKVLYAGLPELKGYETNKSQTTGFGSMISLYVDSPETSRKVLKSIKIFQYAESLGGVESLVTYPFTQTHAEIPEEERRAKGINEELLRISVGIECADDLIEDLRQALE